MSYNTGLWGNDRDGVGAFYFGSVDYNVSAVVDSDINFINNDITFSAFSASDSFDPSWTIENEFKFVYNGETSSTNSSSLQYSYPVNGTFAGVGVKSDVYSSGSIIITDTDYSLTLKINPLPNIQISGTPLPNSALGFSDANADNYFSNTVVSADWDFGDGSTSSTTELTATLEHTYSSVGTYTVSITAYDVSGNEGLDTASISILGGDVCEAKEDYITICGPDMLGRYGDCRRINLRDYLPLYLKGGETEKFVILFEDFLNNMFDGLCGWQLSANELNITKDWSVSSVGSVSAEVNREFTYDLCGTDTPTESTDAEQIEIHWPTNAQYATSAQKISILEKVYRLTELHDPDLIDIEFIQFFAANLGYNVNVSREEVGVSGTTDTFGTTEFGGACSAADINRYLRFVVRNLPTWYKIKTTRNSVKVMLYSFGLVAEVLEYFTDSYLPTSAGGKWILDRNGNLDGVPKNFFPTPHFAVSVDFDASEDISTDIQRRQKVIRAIESIRPINTVFRKLVGYVNRVLNIEVGGYVRMTRYAIIESDGYSNGWG